MLATSFACPECQTVLKTKSAIPPGKKIKCPKCSAVFAVPNGETRPASPIRPKDESRSAPPPRPAGAPPGDSPASRKPVRRPAADEHDERDDRGWDDEDDRPRRARKRKQQGSKALVLSLLIGGGVF